MYLYSFSKYVHSAMDTADDLSFAFMAGCAVASHQTESRSPKTTAPTGDSSFEFFPTAAAGAGQESPSLSDVLAAADDHGTVLLKKKSGRGSGAPKRVTFLLAEPTSRSEREEKGMQRREGKRHRRRWQKQKGLFRFVVSACRECQAVEPSKHAVSNRRIIAV